MKFLLPSLAVAFNPCRRGEVYISASRRCVNVPEIQDLARSQRAYGLNSYGDSEMYADENKCDDGYEYHSYADTCHDVDECEKKLHDCDALTQTCHNLDGTFECVCAEGFEIKIDPENMLGSDGLLDPSFGACEDIDECAEQCNGPGQRCTNSIGSFVCECEPGYEKSPYGVVPFGSCIDIDECVVDPCSENESCRNFEGGFECICLKDHVRDSNGFCIAESACETVGQICQWVCHDVDDSFTCECPEGYSLIGNMCLDNNECAEGHHDCDESELCLNTHGGFVCTEYTECPVGFQSVRGWVDEFSRVKQDTNICHRSNFCDESLPQCKYDLVVSHSTDILSNSQSHPKGTKIYRFETSARYGSSASYGYKILSISNGQEQSVLQDEEFSISQRYRSRPRAYLMSTKPIQYTEGKDELRDLEIEYFAQHRRSKRILYQELIRVRVYISQYDF